MIRLTFLRRLWYSNQYRKYRNKIIEIKSCIDYLSGLETVQTNPATTVRLKAISCRLERASEVSEQLHTANISLADRRIRRCYRSELKHRLENLNNSIERIRSALNDIEPS